jgi:enoyl-CoA hydratase/carnithine racemase
VRHDLAALEGDGDDRRLPHGAALPLESPTGVTSLTPESIEACHARLDDAAGAPIVLCGGKTMFCDGLSLARVSGSDPSTAPAHLVRFGQLLERLSLWDAPVVAVVTGDAMGGGVGLVAVADLAISVGRARFSLPETLVGLVPAVVLPFLAERIGARRSRLLASGYRPIDAEQALAFGLIDEIADDPWRRARSHLARFGRMEPHAVATARALSRSLADPAYPTRAHAAFVDCLASASARERIALLLDGAAPWDAERTAK